MMKMPKISVIVPIYNMEKTLRRALDSIVAQTYKDFEVVMVDDGSTDHSPLICEEYASKYDNFRVLHKINGGLSSARNTGIVESKSQWITFCDSDDYVFSNWLENFRLNEIQDYDLLTQGMKADKPFFGHDELSEESGFDYDGDIEGFLDLSYKHSLIGYTVIKAYRKDIIQKHSLKFDERLWIKEDEVFLFDYLFYCKKIKSSKETGYFYFTPDWSNKYKTSFNDRILLEERIFEAISRIKPSTYSTQIAVENRNAINHELTEEFYKTKKRFLVKKLHEYFQTYPDFARLSFPTRAIVQKDPTGFFSSFILYLHMSLRKILGKGIV